MRKFENCDLLAVLGEIASHNTKNFSSDFLIDEEILLEAAQEKNGLDRRYLWMSRSCGTHCLKEKDVFLQGTSEQNTWTAYSDKAKEIIAFAVEVIGFEEGVLKGDLYELDYASHCAFVCDKAEPIGQVVLHCKDTDIVFPYSEDWRQNAQQYNYADRDFIPSDVNRYETLLGNLRAERLNGHYYPWDLDKLALEYSDNPAYRIYQLKREAHDGLFLSYHEAKKKGIDVCEKNYELTYIGESENRELEDIFVELNVDRPEDFCGHSLSVSDVIVFTENEKMEAYYVDRYGFEPLPNFFNAAQKIPAQM